MTERNYQHELLELVNKSVPTRGEFIVSEVAAKLVSSLEERDPELLQGWLAERAPTIMTDYISDLVGRRRRSAAVGRRAEARSVFANAAAAADSGNVEPLQKWLDQYYVVDDAFTRRALADMTKADLAFVEADYTRRIKENSLEREFIVALKKKVPAGKTVKDVLSEEKIRALYDSLAA